MWNRVELKMRAKQAFYNNYWPYVAVGFLLMLTSYIAGGGSAANSSKSNSLTHADSYTYKGGFYGEHSFAWPAVGLLIGTIALVLSIFFLLFSIFVGNIIEVGAARFFMLNQTCRAGVSTVFSGFRTGHYGNLLIAMLLRDIYVFLWSLLLIIPGIVKYYEYLMVPYILSENPGLDRREAFIISRRMMMGQKMDAFLLTLSFIGWLLLSAITCGLVGIFFVTPYMEATFAELYAENRRRAFHEGYIK